MPSILIAAGGTGGHVYPALAVAELLRDRGHGVAFAGGDRIEARIVPEAGFELHVLPARSLPRRPTPAAAVAAVAFARSLASARGLLARLGTDVVLGMGGYPSLAPCLAAGRRIPVVLHEQNATLSLANRLSVRRARVLALSLPLSGSPRSPVRMVTTGNPLRAPVRAVAADRALRGSRRREAEHRWGLHDDRLTVLVSGGSLGASVLNQTLPVEARSWSPEAVQVLHISGPDHADEVRSAWSGADVHAVVLPYVDRMEDAYAAADVAVCRAGASTVAELTAFGLPSVLVPLPLAPRGAQETNARVLERAGAGTVVLQGDGFGSRLQTAVGPLLRDAEARATMGAAAARLGLLDAAPRLADLVEGLA